MMRVGLIGLGAIGSGALSLLRPHDEVEVVGALVRDVSRSRQSHLNLFSDVDQLLAARPDVVVEAAGHEALRCYGPVILRAGIDLLMVSVGALADRHTEQALTEAACAGNSRAFVVSGAIGGLDAIAAARVGGVKRVVHTTRKPARALLPPEEAASLTEPRELFRGTARKGVLRFPESINVAAAVSLAGIGLDHTQVVVIADPAIDRNHHEVKVEGNFGELRFEISSIPTNANPRTGRLVAMSVVHALRRRQARLVVG